MALPQQSALRFKTAKAVLLQTHRIFVYNDEHQGEGIMCQSKVTAMKYIQLQLQPSRPK